MRYLLPILAAALIALACFLFFGRADRISSREGEAELLALTREASVSIAYTLDRERWTSFQIPAGRGPLRVITNASIPDSRRTRDLPPELEWKYSIVYEALDGNGKILARRVYHQRTRLTKYLDRNSSRSFIGAFYLSPPFQPADSRIMLINPDELSNPATLRFRLADCDPEVRDVSIRVYAPETNPDHKLYYIWHRMNETQKDRLAGGNVYPKELLTEEEKRSIVSRLWAPLGPSGVRGRNYDPRELYIVTEIEGDATQPAGIPTGIPLDALRRGIVTLPEQGGDILLRFEPSGTAGPTTGTIAIRWFGKGPANRTTHHLAWRGVPTSFRRGFSGGLLEVTAPASMGLRSFVIRNGKESEITPEPFFLRSYVADAGRPLEFSVEHDGNLPTPLRIDIRRTMAPGADRPGPERVAFHFLDHAGRTVREGSLPITFTPSPYDGVAIQSAPLLSEPDAFYFSVPVTVKSVRITPRSQALIAVYNRPPALVREIRVPEDYVAAYTNVEHQPSWFFLNHPDHGKLLQQNRTALLTIQLRPPQDIPDLISGRYWWEDYHPEGEWLARRILTPWEGRTVFHADSLPAVFRPLPVGIATMIEMTARPGLQQVEPTLIYQRQSASPASVRVTVDGACVYAGILAGSVGELKLQPVIAGKHAVTVLTAAPARFYLNYGKPAAGSMLVRLANRFRARGLRFSYEKRTPTEEILSARLYVPATRKGEVLLTVRCTPERRSGEGPWKNWSFPDRKYRVRFDGTDTARALQTEDNLLNGAEPLFIPLGDDMPPGRYTFSFTIDRGDAYLLLARTVPGIPSRREILKEGEIRTIEIPE